MSDWFKSRNIGPYDASEIMWQLTANLIAHCTDSIAEADSTIEEWAESMRKGTRWIQKSNLEMN